VRTGPHILVVDIAYTEQPGPRLYTAGPVNVICNCTRPNHNSVFISVTHFCSRFSKLFP